MQRRALILLLALAPAPLSAAGFGLFQHGGRATAQVGAFVARADDPAAVRYNPAAIARLDGLQIEAGLDFQAPKDEFSTAAGTDLPHHIINFPAALYATWRPKGLTAPLTFGLGLDSPFWTIENWDTALFPGRFDTLRQDVTLYELRPTVAWAIDQRWSLGAALRFVAGSLETSFATRQEFASGPGTIVASEVVSSATSRVDGFGLDLGLHYAAPGWGWGLVLGSGVALDGSGDLDSWPREPLPNAIAEAELARRFPSQSAALDFALPPSAALGLWWGFGPAVKVEADLTWSGWSALDRTRIRIAQDPYATPPPALDRRRNWNDVVSLRIGAEWAIAEQVSLGAGLAFEPSPVPEATREPGFPQGNAVVLALGASWNLPGLSFDFGYSYHQQSDARASLDSLDLPVNGNFGGRAHIFALSARWRL